MSKVLSNFPGAAGGAVADFVKALEEVQAQNVQVAFPPGDVFRVSFGLEVTGRACDTKNLQQLLNGLQCIIHISFWIVRGRGSVSFNSAAMRYLERENITIEDGVTNLGIFNPGKKIEGEDTITLCGTHPDCDQITTLQIQVRGTEEPCGDEEEEFVALSSMSDCSSSA